MPDHFTLLLEWRRNESAVRGLAKLPHDFYPATQAYLAEVRRTYEVDLRENPSGRKGEIARQTYQRASQLARDIVEGRVQKLLSVAFQASVGSARDLPNALPEERGMFDRVLEVLLAHRRSAAPYLEPGGPPNPVSIPPPRPAGALPLGPPASSAPAKPVSAPPPAARGPAPLEFVRVLAGGRPIEVGAETLDLRADDVVSLPAEVAKLLVNAKVAEPVATSPVPPTT